MPRALKPQNPRSRSSAPLPSAKVKERPRCLICGTHFGQKKDLNRHMETIHSTEKPKYQCTYPGCTAVMRQKSNLVTHQKIHTQNKDRICTWPYLKRNGKTCAFKCTDPSSFDRHLKSHVGFATDRNEPIPERFLGVKARVLKLRAQKEAESQVRSCSSTSGDEVEQPEPVGPPSSSCASSSHQQFNFSLSSEASPEDYVAARIYDPPSAFTTDSSSSGYASPSDSGSSDISDVFLSSSNSFEKPRFQPATPETHVSGLNTTESHSFPECLTALLQPLAAAESQVSQVHFPHVPLPQYTPYPDPQWQELYDLIHEAPKPQPTQAHAPEYPTSLDGIEAMLYQDMGGHGSHFPSLYNSL